VAVLIYMRTVPGHPEMRALTRPLLCETQDRNHEFIPVGFTWDGSSAPWIFNGIFPRHRHPIASCRHDWRCGHATNSRERAWADKEFEKDVGKTSWWITKKLGYVGVRIGALFGIGSNF
jgi:hypothetical protein